MANTTAVARTAFDAIADDEGFDTTRPGTTAKSSGRPKTEVKPMKQGPMQPRGSIGRAKRLLPKEEKEDSGEEDKLPRKRKAAVPGKHDLCYFITEDGQCPRETQDYCRTRDEMTGRFTCCNKCCQHHYRKCTECVRSFCLNCIDEHLENCQDKEPDGEDDDHHDDGYFDEDEGSESEEDEEPQWSFASGSVPDEPRRATLRPRS